MPMPTPVPQNASHKCVVPYWFMYKKSEEIEREDLSGVRSWRGGVVDAAAAIAHHDGEEANECRCDGKGVPERYESMTSRVVLSGLSSRSVSQDMSFSLSVLRLAKVTCLSP